MRTSPIVVAGLLCLAACGSDGDDEADFDIEGVEIERVGEYTHVLADLDYDEPAPSGGDHPPAPYWLTCGVYDGEVPAELAVHSLEHGAVWVALGPAATSEDRAAAEELAAQAEGRVIVSDVPDLANPVELVAWGFRLPLDTAEDERAARFIEEYVDGPAAPEAGASCASVGEPPTPPPLPLG